MKKIVNNGLYLAAGLVIGSVATYFLGIKKIERDVNKEFEQIKNDWYKEQEESSLYFHEIEPDEPEPENATPKSRSISDIAMEKVRPMSEIVAKNLVKNREKKPVTEYSKMYGPKHEDDAISIEEYMDKAGIITTVPEDHQHLITSEEFSDDLDYEKYHCILYSDGILAEDDTDNEIIDYQSEDADNPIEADVLYGFLMDENMDELFYRNDILGRDYEIIKSAKLYNE